MQSTFVRISIAFLLLVGAALVFKSGQHTGQSRSVQARSSTEPVYVPPSPVNIPPTQADLTEPASEYDTIGSNGANTVSDVYELDPNLTVKRFTCQSLFRPAAYMVILEGTSDTGVKETFVVKSKRDERLLDLIPGGSLVNLKGKDLKVAAFESEYRGKPQWIVEEFIQN